MKTRRIGCGAIHLESVKEYGRTAEEYRAFACGFVSGQAEKVYLGVCPAAMFRPSDENATWFLAEVRKSAKRYKLAWTMLPSHQPVTSMEIWICRPGYPIGLWLTSEVNSAEWHNLRAAACGIPEAERDPAYHERAGYGQKVD